MYHYNVTWTQSVSRETSITVYLPLSHLFYPFILTSPQPPFATLFSFIQHLTYSVLSLPGFSLNISIHTFLFLCYLPFAFIPYLSLSLFLSGTSLMRTGKWGTNKTLNPRHRKSLSFGINVRTISHTLYWQVYKCVLLSTWQHPDKSGNIQGGPVLTGLNMHQFSC